MLKPLTFTAFAVTTSLLLNSPVAIPVKLTASTAYGLPSLLLPAPGAADPSSTADPTTVAALVPS